MEQFFKTDGTVLTVKLPPEIDHHNAEELCRAADRIIQKSVIRMVVFDFAQTEFMDSSGIGMIMGRYRDMRLMGGRVIAVNAGERMRRILKLSGVSRLIDIYEGEPRQAGRV